jgi:hypothetical protein
MTGQCEGWLVSFFLPIQSLCSHQKGRSQRTCLGSGSGSGSGSGTARRGLGPSGPRRPRPRDNGGHGCRPVLLPPRRLRAPLLLLLLLLLLPRHVRQPMAPMRGQPRGMPRAASGERGRLRGLARGSNGGDGTVSGEGLQLRACREGRGRRGEERRRRQLQAAGRRRGRPRAGGVSKGGAPLRALPGPGLRARAAGSAGQAEGRTTAAATWQLRREGLPEGVLLRRGTCCLGAGACRAA